jgi:hypothetical protein
MLAFCAVLVVVLTSLIVQTIIEKGPIVFLKLAEISNGEIDGVYLPSSMVSFSPQIYYPQYK